MAFKLWRSLSLRLLLLLLLPLSASWTAAEDDAAVARSAFPIDGDVAWVVQVSDLHISAHHPDRADDLVDLLGPALRAIRPHLLIVSGDITGAYVAREDGARTRPSTAVNGRCGPHPSAPLHARAARSRCPNPHSLPSLEPTIAGVPPPSVVVVRAPAAAAVAMPSWNDGESSTGSFVSEFTDADYAPDWIEDPEFRGVAVECPEVCRVHRLDPKKVVAFEGTNTGRRFYICPVQNQVSNCGFVSWVDPEWPQPAKNALAKLWEQYNESNSARIDDMIDHGKLVEQLSDEKNRLDKKYTSLMADVKKFIETTEKNALEENRAKMIDNTTVEAKLALTEKLKEEAEKELAVVEKERNMYRAEVFELKQLDKCNVERIKMMEKKWEEEKEGLKDEKRNIEYTLYDLFKISEVNKGKLKKIKEICDE